MHLGQQEERLEPATLQPERRERRYYEPRAILLKLPGGLTQRKAEICASIALGYTPLGGQSETRHLDQFRRYAPQMRLCQAGSLFAERVVVRYFDSMDHSVH